MPAVSHDKWHKYDVGLGIERIYVVTDNESAPLMFLYLQLSFRRELSIIQYFQGSRNLGIYGSSLIFDNSLPLLV
jgi:hypothetical protein